MFLKQADQRGVPARSAGLAAPGPGRSLRLAVATSFVGLGVTVLAGAAPYVHRDGRNGLAGHLRAGYPDYSATRIDHAVHVYLTYLTTLNAIGVVCWLVMTWSIVTARSWAFRAAVTLLVGALTIAVFDLVVKDTSGDTGLPGRLGWIELLPCLPGALLVALVRLRRPAPSADA